MENPNVRSAVDTVNTSVVNLQEVISHNSKIISYFLLLLLLLLFFSGGRGRERETDRGDVEICYGRFLLLLFYYYFLLLFLENNLLGVVGELLLDF